jgi:hypothetical protein
LTRRTWATFVAGLLVGALAMLVGLAQAGRLAPAQPQMLVALAQLVETEHRRVDVLVERGDVAGAIAALEALRGQTWPSREDGGDMAVQIRHDVYGRLMRLRLDYPDVETKPDTELLAIADEGLGSDWRDVDANPFTARLVALRGEILELLDRDDEALAAYEHALDMNAVLLDRELGGSAP